MNPTAAGSAPSFTPALPERVEPTAMAALLEHHSGDTSRFFAELDDRGGVLVTAGPTPDTAVVAFAHPATDDRTEVFVLIDTITHMLRDQLEHFRMAPLRGVEQRVQAVAFVLPQGLRATTGLLVETDRDPRLTQDRATWRGVYARTRALSAQRSSVRDADGGRASVLALPAAPPSRWTDAESTGELSAPTSVAHRFPRVAGLRTGVIDSTTLGVRMRVWAAVPHPAHGDPTAVIAIADGDRWRNDCDLLSALERMHDDGACAPTTAVFFSPDDPRRRAEVLGMNERLPDFLVDELLPWAAEFSSVPGDPGRRAIAGASLGGLAAADVVRRRPDAFGNAVVQSGSFWWPGPGADEPAEEQLRLWRSEGASLADRVRVFQEVGDQEGHLRDDNRAFRDILLDNDVPITYREYTGGHDYACWRVGVLDAIGELFPPQ